MTNIFTIWTENDPSQLCVRDLRPGMIVPLGAKMITVSSVSRMDPPVIIAGGMPSAMAIKVEFLDHEPLIAHPGAVVMTLPGWPARSHSSP